MEWCVTYNEDLVQQKHTLYRKHGLKLG